MTQEQEAAMYKTISEQTPGGAGLALFCNWIAPLACQFVKYEFHVRFSEHESYDAEVFHTFLRNIY